MKLTQTDINNYKQAFKKTQALAKKIDKRVGEILALICKIFNARFRTTRKNKQLVWWYTTEQGELYTDIFGTDDIEYGISNLLDPINNGIWDYEEQFPTKFLTMTNAQIRKYIKNEIEHAKKMNKLNQHQIFAEKNKYSQQ